MTLVRIKYKAGPGYRTPALLCMPLAPRLDCDSNALYPIWHIGSLRRFSTQPARGCYGTHLDYKGVVGGCVTASGPPDAPPVLPGADRPSERRTRPLRGFQGLVRPSQGFPEGAQPGAASQGLAVAPRGSRMERRRRAPAAAPYGGSYGGF